MIRYRRIFIVYILIILLGTSQTIVFFPPSYAQEIDKNFKNEKDHFKKIDKKIFEYAESKKIKNRPHSKFNLNDEKILVQIIADLKHVNDLNSQIHILGQQENSSFAKVSLNKIKQLVQFNWIYQITLIERSIQHGHAAGEGVQHIFADKTHLNGLTGKGVKIAIIDNDFFVNDPEIVNNVVSSKLFDSGDNCSASKSCGKTQGNSHGTAVAEIVVDTAPNVELYLYTIGFSEDLSPALDDAKTNNVDIIVIPIGFLNQDPDGVTGLYKDGTASTSKKVSALVNDGILVVVSAGNNAQSHWSGEYVPSTTISPEDLGISGESVMEFNPSAVGKQKACLPITQGTDPNLITTALVVWDEWGLSTNDYDVRTFDSAMTNWVSVSESSQNSFSPKRPIEGLIIGDPEMCLVLYSWSSTETHSFHIDVDNGNVNLNTITTPRGTDIVNALGSGAPGCENTNSCFRPQTLQIDVGDTVTWFNGDTSATTFTSGTPNDGANGVFNSGLIQTKEKYSFTFNTAGTYPYFDIVHPWKVGQIVVGQNSPITSQAYQLISGSLNTPADATGALTVGAVNTFDNTMISTSSAGPTDDGRQKPEICGPGSVLTHQSGFNPFVGTSPAAAYVGGAAAILLEQNPNLTGSELRQKLITQTQSNPNFSLDNACGKNSGIVSLNTASVICRDHPESGDWVIPFDCKLTNDVIAPGKVIIQDNSVLEIPSGNKLEMDFENNNLQIKQGSSIIIKEGGKIKSTEFIITSLSKSSAMPFELLTVTGSGFDATSKNLAVRFFDNNGFTVDIKSANTKTASVTVSVPPIFDTTTGLSSSGIVGVQLVQSTGTGFIESNVITGFQIQDLPTSTNTPGSELVSFLNEQVNAMNLLKTTITGTVYDTIEFRQDLDVSITKLNQIIAQIQTIVDDSNQSVNFGTYVGNSVFFTSESLRQSDRMVLAFKLAENANLNTQSFEFLPKAFATHKERFSESCDTQSAFATSATLLGLIALGGTVTLSAGATAPVWATLAAASSVWASVMGITVAIERHYWIKSIENISITNDLKKIGDIKNCIDIGLSELNTILGFLNGNPVISLVTVYADFLLAGADSAGKYLRDLSFFSLSIKSTSGGSVNCAVKAPLVTVFSSIPKCDGTFVKNSKVKATTIPNDGFIFSGWGNGCNKRNECTFVMDSSTTAIANFEESNTLSVSVNPSNGGTVSCSGKYIPKDCNDEVPDTVANIRATPNTGFNFKDWSGECLSSGTSPQCIIGINADKSTTANFIQNSFILSTATNGGGSGSISCSGADTFNTCNGSVDNGNTVTLTANPNSGSTFTGWSGTGISCPGTGNCSFTMSSDKVVFATFETSQSLTITPSSRTISMSDCIGGQTSTGTTTFDVNVNPESLTWKIVLDDQIHEDNEYIIDVFGGGSQSTFNNAGDSSQQISGSNTILVTLNIPISTQFVSSGVSCNLAGGSNDFHVELINSPSTKANFVFNYDD